jgi:hypothetical protein
VLVAVMSRGVMWRGRIMDRMRRRCSVSRCDGLSASQMQRRFAGYPGPETKPDTTVMAPLVGHRAQRVALCMIAGSSAWAPGRTGSGNHKDAHGFNLAVFSAAIRNFPTSRLRFTLELLTICSKVATYS